MKLEKHPIRTGIISLALATLFWSFTSPLVKRFSLHQIDGDVQNLYRYAAATFGSFLWVLLAFRAEGAAALRQWRLFLLPTAINFIFQIIMVKGLYQKSIYPGFTSLASQSSVIFATILAYILFRDERPIIRSPRYLLGLLLAISGLVGVVIFGAHTAAANFVNVPKGDFALGAFFVLVSALLWACYTLAMKPVVRAVRPVVAFAYVAGMTTVLFAILTSVQGRPGQFLDVSLLDQSLIVLSGVLCISVAHSMYFRAVDRLGVAICSSFILSQPLLTNIISAITLGEPLSIHQLAMGGMLLIGVYLVVSASTTRNAPIQAPGEQEP